MAEITLGAGAEELDDRFALVADGHESNTQERRDEDNGEDVAFGERFQDVRWHDAQQDVFPGGHGGRHHLRGVGNGDPGRRVDEDAGENARNARERIRHRGEEQCRHTRAAQGLHVPDLRHPEGHGEQDQRNDDHLDGPDEEVTNNVDGDGGIRGKESKDDAADHPEKDFGGETHRLTGVQLSRKEAADATEVGVERFRQLGIRFHHVGLVESVARYQAHDRVRAPNRSRFGQLPGRCESHRTRGLGKDTGMASKIALGAKHLFIRDGEHRACRLARGA